jgi:hypothetical protein
MHPLSVTRRRIFNAPPDYADNDTSYLLLSSTYRYLSQHSSRSASWEGFTDDVSTRRRLEGPTQPTGRKLLALEYQSTYAYTSTYINFETATTQRLDHADGIGHFDDRPGSKTRFSKQAHILPMLAFRIAVAVLFGATASATSLRQLVCFLSITVPSCC